MKFLHPLLLITAFASALLPASASGQKATEQGGAALPVRSQNITLQKGWNAVWLEVSPLQDGPDAVFKDVPVDIAARYLQPATSIKFISDPVDKPWNQPGWAVWYAPSRKDGFIRSLHSITGNAAYLVHASRNCQWRVEGTVRFRRMEWVHNAFNLAGFTLDENNPPTFGSFFAPTGGKTGGIVYRLVEGRWAKLPDPEHTVMRSGESCWIFSTGPADFQGPLDVRITRGEAVDFGTDSIDAGVSYVNATSGAVSVALDMPGAGSTSQGGLPLAQVQRDLSALKTSAETLTGGKSLPLLESGKSRTLTLRVNRDSMASGTQTALLSLTAGGQRVWVPVRASKGVTP